MELDMLIRSALSDAKWLIAKGGTDRAEVLNRVMGNIDEALKSGLAVRRKGWNGKGLFVVKQIPSHIEGGIIPKMQSLPQSAKNILLSREGAHIDYINQMLIINLDGRADSWVPSSSDVFAEDWEVVVTELYDDSCSDCDAPSPSAAIEYLEKRHAK